MRHLTFYGVLSFVFTVVSAKTAYTPGAPRVHDQTFTPNHVLRVSRKEFCVGGIRRYTTLVNDTLPGPELHIPEEKVVWIRVYNDMNDANLTMVSQQASSSTLAPAANHKTTTALAWPCSGCRALLGRHSHGQPVAHPAASLL